MAISPDEPSYRYSYAHALMQQGRMVEASTELQKVLEKEPRNADFHNDYGYVLAQLGFNEKAGEEYATAVQLDPKSARVRYNHAMYLAQNNQPEQAMSEFEKCLEFNPKSAEAHYYLGHLYYEKGDMPNAKAHYVEASRLDPTAPIHNSLGVVYMRLGQVSEAIESFNEALRRRPDDADAAENLRFALSSSGRSTPP